MEVSSSHSLVPSPPALKRSLHATRAAVAASGLVSAANGGGGGSDEPSLLPSLGAKAPAANNNDLPRTNNGAPQPSDVSDGSQTGRECELHDIPDCEWCALGVKNRSAYGRLWPYAEHPLTREHYCLEPVEGPPGVKFPCCSLRREKPIKTSQGYAGHLASHRAHLQGSTTTNATATAATPVGATASVANSSSVGPTSSSDHTWKKRKRELSLGSLHEATTTTTTTTSSSNGTKAVPKFVASLQPSLPRCDLEAGQLRFFLLPQDSCGVDAINVVFKGHRGKLVRRVVKDADGLFVVACPLITELLPPNDTRTTFEVSVRVEDLTSANRRRLFQSSLLFTRCVGQASTTPSAQATEQTASNAVRHGKQEEAEDEEEEVMATTTQTSSSDEPEADRDMNVDYQDREDRKGGFHTHAPTEDSKLKEEDTAVKQEKRRKTVQSERPRGREEGRSENDQSRAAMTLETKKAVPENDETACPVDIDNEDEQGATDSKRTRRSERIKRRWSDEANGATSDKATRAQEAKDTKKKAKTEASSSSSSSPSLPPPSVSLLPDVVVKLEQDSTKAEPEAQPHFEEGRTPDVQPVRHSQIELPDLLAQLAEVAVAESHNARAASSASASASASVTATNSSNSRPTMTEALHAIPPGVVSSLMPWAHMSLSTGGASLSSLLPSQLTSADAEAYIAAAAAALAADPHTAALFLPGLLASQSYYNVSPPLPLRSLLPQPTLSPPPSSAPQSSPLATLRAKPELPAATSFTLPPSRRSIQQSRKPLSWSSPVSTLQASGPTTAPPSPSPMASQPMATPLARSMSSAAMSTSTPSLRLPVPHLPPQALDRSGAAAPQSVPPSSAASPFTSAAADAVTKREKFRVYFYTVLPEKGKLIWVVFFSNRRHSLGNYELLLHEVPASSPTYDPVLAQSAPSLTSPPPSLVPLPTPRTWAESGTDASAAAPLGVIEMGLPISAQQTIVLPPVNDLSWIAEGSDMQTNERLYQHKVCFQAPDTTYERRVFSTTLHNRVERTMTLLGGLSLVSTTSQREPMWSRINQWFTAEVHQKLVDNCKRHPPSRRHFLNGKGSRQGSKQPQKDRFLFDELEKAVELESVSLSTSPS